MCGIMGYIGNREAQPILINGLRKLEYRGYDSAGIAICDGATIGIRKAKGRIDVLESQTQKSGLHGSIGIGHTRWATHGRPSDENSHPHFDQSGKFSIVHNGIIENYLDLKQELIEKGVTFTSETDTEVIVHLLAQEYDNNLVAAVQKVAGKIRGAFALGVMTEHEPDKLIAVRMASPLIIGVGENENFIGSDIPAILEHTRDVYVLEDGDLAILTKDSVHVMRLDTTEPIERELVRIEWDKEQAEKDGFAHYMQKEIYEQPRALRNTMTGRIDATQQKVIFPNLQLSEVNAKRVEKIYIVACGTAYHAGLIGKHVIERLAQIPVEVDVASEFRYRRPLFQPHTLTIAVSQSGETADTLAAMREAKRNGSAVLAITNVVGSSIARDADDVITTNAGPEIAVASTKAYTSQLIAFYLLGIYLAQAKGTLDAHTRASLLHQLTALPDQVEHILAHADQIRHFAESIKDEQHLFFIGRGLDHAVSMEGSLKLKEISYIHSEAYAAGELKHGTLALIEEGTRVIALATQDELHEKMISNITEVKARGAKVLGITLDGHVELHRSVDDVCLIPQTDALLTPVLGVIPLQLISYYTSVALGNDVDRPRNLAKSVTVE
ncbi:glutamine--fructose-6-phosphate transaminase (isomerizing) [Brevibacillus porteri]|uniref:Glutamine--fructose-6-phosphate aminotransferase [isomerizing] n=1 Tax=Brevibacillus porteri TaxID=2126350 RepID=A0ABX5FW57_9BACL|nr:glutamine--fructose-6-phosphate transaminase (isomerizing) [Brevibacillus porteri]MED1797653.1 glutamine--fructose-6-phosphate transaminase (isomerizing) [Brevibacillus porteri]MED2130607.1 glutamine--fructose-6-phosphate transaminase (isomerizing) [Brevibacillus porteri]MED2746221.1 glutamine--fructose-6-phosphate transaminase (isomerizing) [Brevibacillus porteri]MED2818015.1 glutamine--fructose-6-phosphate transaminase (isomerizing) [Brevibacillus porteri]MED2895180.1 glutamine--fructose-